MTPRREITTRLQFYSPNPYLSPSIWEMVEHAFASPEFGRMFSVEVKRDRQGELASTATLAFRATGVVVARIRSTGSVFVDEKGGYCESLLESEKAHEAEHDLVLRVLLQSSDQIIAHEAFEVTWPRLRGAKPYKTQPVERVPWLMTLWSLEKLVELWQDGWRRGRSKQWTKACREAEISPKTAGGYMPQLQKNWKDPGHDPTAELKGVQQIERDLR